MSSPLDVTPLILTFNEAANIQRTLERLKWAEEIVVVDSFSTDQTVQILSQFQNVRVVQRVFDTFAEQCNYGLLHVRTDWVLSLDADYVVPDCMNDALLQLDLQGATAGFRLPFRYCVFGHPLRASLYPPRTVLYRRASARYRNDGHGHRVIIEGIVDSIPLCIDHDDRKPLERWIAEQARYAAQEAELLTRTPFVELALQDRLRKRIVFAPFLVLLYTLLGKRLILDGWPGMYYVAQRVFAELMLSLRLMDKMLRK
jgi:glycosyltransferase involved in cell wall biosynthesis